jgi:putative ABC transport system permease protein
MVGTLVIYDQLAYIRNKDTGYNREQLLIIQNTYGLKNQASVFRDALLKITGVQNGTVSGFLPVNGNRNNDVFFKDASLDIQQSVSMQEWAVDEQYIPTLQIQLVKGRNFSPAFLSDSGAFIINETAARQLGITDITNKNIYQIDDFKTKKTISTHRIIGIMKDFNFNSLHDPVTPLALYLKRDAGSITLRVRTSHLHDLLQQIEEKWKTFAPAQPFSYSFMDEDFLSQYLAEQRTGKISVAFSILAILVACIGLFGLVTFAAQQRVKEISIRKILGATVPGIITLLSKDFLKLVLLAILIASPVAYWIMHQWLANFAYRVAISWKVFVWAGLTGLLIALVTILYQGIKAALANPANSLRTE